MDTTTIQDKAAKGFDQVGEGVRSAVDEFEKTVTPENITAALALLAPVAEFGKNAMKTTIDYSKRHPYRIAITVAALGLLAYRAMQPKHAEPAKVRA